MVYSFGFVYKGNIMVAKLFGKKEKVAKGTLDKDIQQNNEESCANENGKDCAGNTEELDSVKQQLIRVSADFQNFRKRAEKERSVLIEMGQTLVAEAFLPFLDDLQRALQASEQHELSEQEKAWLEGFNIIEKNLQKTFKDLDIKEIDCSKDFDPEYHEALMQVDSPDHKSGEIVTVVNKGYLFKDKVLRHAKVGVAK